MSILEHFDHSFRKQDKAHFKHLVQVALADGKIDPNEMRLTYKLALTTGFPADQITNLPALLIDGIGKGLGNDELFALFKEKGKML